MHKRKHSQQFKDEYSAQWPVLKKSKVSKNHIFCCVCNTDFSIAHGGKDDCRRHVECARHVQNAKLQSSSEKFTSFFNKSNDLSVINAESLFTSFLIEHNCPLSAADHAGSLFKKMFPDSTIASKYGCARTKTTAIIKSFSKKTVEEIVDILKSVKFSLATDGSNSSEIGKLFPILVTYFDVSSESNVTMMISLPRLNGGATGENIFKLLDAELEKLGVPWKNCISFSSDNASVMTGKFKGVIKFIKEKNPDVILNGCACHLIHLAAKHSTKELNFPIEEFLIDIFYYLKKSSTRLDLLKSCQEFCEVEVHKILKYGSTRWLSMEKVINRILEQWDPLKMFFLQLEEGESDALLRIKRKFEDPLTKLYLFFLKSALPIFNQANIFLQTKGTSSA